MKTKILQIRNKNLIPQLSFIILLIIIVALPFSCDDFLEKQPKGVVFTESLANKVGVNYLLIGAYSGLSGAKTSTDQIAAHAASVRNWMWDCASDDAYKGSTSGDVIEIGDIERYETQIANTLINSKWVICYDGVSRANDVLTTLAMANDIEESEATLIEAQSKFLRAWWHFRLQEMFWQIPYITQNDEIPELVTNDHAVWPEIEDDLQFAIDHLPGEWPEEPGRATKWAAMAYKAYVYLFQQEYSKAKPLLDAIISSNHFDLVENFHDNYSPITENNIESVFEIQSTVNDGSGSRTYNGNADSWLTNAVNSVLPTCCGFYQPSQDLVNAFKVNSDGLPLLGINGPKYNDENLKNDMRIRSDEEFIPSDQLIDPRLDWTVGRRGIPYLDWGIHTGSNWIRSQENGGPYITVKQMYYKRDQDIAAHASWKRATSINYRALRYAHILLWRAECAIEEGDLETARQLINRVRRRASDDIILGKVDTYSFPASVEIEVDWTKPAANYLLGEYSSFPNQDYAREAVRMEERLEFAMEGWRFFDLVRWGIDDEVLTKYIENDSKFRTFMTGATYEKDKNSRWPIPQTQLDLQPGILEQDPAW